MANRIRKIFRYIKVDDPTLAEVGIRVDVEKVGPGTEIRGHLTGPRCAYATTVEVAYPLRAQLEKDEEFEELFACFFEDKREPSFLAEVVIPEPSLWEPETPFLYESRVELWENGQCCDRVTFSFGLCEARFGEKGLRLNGRSVALRGVARYRFAPEDLAGLRQAGFNTLLTFPDPDNAALWEAADQLGFFILSRIWGLERVSCVPRLSRHTCALGWVIADGMEEYVTLALMTSLAQAGSSDRSRLSLEVSRKPSQIMPIFQSLICDALLLADLNSIPLPKLVLLNQTSVTETESQELLATPGVCGWVLEPFL